MITLTHTYIYKTVLVILIGLYSTLSVAAEPQRNFVKVDDPYIELHSGPGRGFPIFHVVARGDWIEVVLRKTDWFRVKTEDGKDGWVDAAQLVMTLDPDGKRVQVVDPGEDEFRDRRWEYGVGLGDFSGGTVLRFSAGYNFNQNIATEIAFSSVIGSASTSYLMGVHLMDSPFPDWKISPYFSLGAGVKKTQPNANLTQARDREDSYSQWGIGLRMHFTKRLLLRMEFRNYVIYTSTNDNEEIDEWTAGFGFFF